MHTLMIGGSELPGGGEGQGSGEQPDLRWASRAGGIEVKNSRLVVGLK